MPCYQIRDDSFNKIDLKVFESIVQYIFKGTKIDKKTKKVLPYDEFTLAKGETLDTAIFVLKISDNNLQTDSSEIITKIDFTTRCKPGYGKECRKNSLFKTGIQDIELSKKTRKKTRKLTEEEQNMCNKLGSWGHDYCFTGRREVEEEIEQPQESQRKRRELTEEEKRECRQLGSWAPAHCSSMIDESEEIDEPIEFFDEEVDNEIEEPIEFFDEEVDNEIEETRELTEEEKAECRQLGTWAPPHCETGKKEIGPHKGWDQKIA